MVGTHALLYDLPAVSSRVSAVRAAFPAHWHHCFAVKASPLRPMLQYLTSLGLGLEAASPGELIAAVRHIPATCVAYDSPLKTVEDLHSALSAGAFVNADSLEELQRIAAWVEERGGGSAALAPGQRIGVRINPQVGAGAIAATSTAVPHSKFGVPLHDAGVKDAVVAAYLAHPWLTALHIHVGSQGVPLERAAAGVAEVVALCGAINTARAAATPPAPPIARIDVGGGLPVNFGSDDDAPTPAEWAAVLRAAAPALWDAAAVPEVWTEFGRYYLAKSGVFVTRVEYAKHAGGRQIAVQAVGADLAIRTVYHPETWPLRISLLPRPDGTPLADEDLVPTDVAGPCCFQADVIAHARPMPRLRSLADHLVVWDVGAYYFASFSHYNVRATPAVLAIPGDIPQLLRVLRSAQTPEEAAAFFD